MKKLIMAGILALTLIFTPICAGNSFTELKRVVSEHGVRTQYSIIHSTFTSSDMKGCLLDTIDLRAGDTWHVYINTPGGDAFSTVGLINYMDSLRNRGVRIVTEASGAIMSAGAIIFMAGDVRIGHKGDLFMFHSVAQGSATKPSQASTRHHKYVMMHLNHWLRQRFLDQTHSTEVTNRLLKHHDDGNYNWFNSQELLEMGVVTEIK